jgi:hypothetical protein
MVDRRRMVMVGRRMLEFADDRMDFPKLSALGVVSVPDLEAHLTPKTGVTVRYKRSIIGVKENLGPGTDSCAWIKRKASIRYLQRT